MDTSTHGYCSHSAGSDDFHNDDQSTSSDPAVPPPYTAQYNLRLVLRAQSEAPADSAPTPASLAEILPPEYVAPEDPEDVVLQPIPASSKKLPLTPPVTPAAVPGGFWDEILKLSEQLWTSAALNMQDLRLQVPSQAFMAYEEASVELAKALEMTKTELEKGFNNSREGIANRLSIARTEITKDLEEGYQELEKGLRDAAADVAAELSRAREEIYLALEDVKSQMQASSTLFSDGA